MMYIVKMNTASFTLLIFITTRVGSAPMDTTALLLYVHGSPHPPTTPTARAETGLSVATKTSVGMRERGIIVFVAVPIQREVRITREELPQMCVCVGIQT